MPKRRELFIIQVRTLKVRDQFTCPEISIYKKKFKNSEKYFKLSYIIYLDSEEVMDIKSYNKDEKNHYETYAGFINLIQASSIIIAIILILMAIFLL